MLEQAKQEPLREEGYHKLKAAIRTLGYVTELLEKKEATLASLRELLCPASTEKTDKVLKQAGIDTGEKKSRKPFEEAEGKRLPDTGAMARRPIAERKRSKFRTRR